MDVLQRLSEKLYISPSVQETAAVIYRKALKKGLVKGRTIVALVAASLYAACRLAEVPKTLREIVEASLRDREEVARSYRLLLRRLEIKVPFQTPVEYVAKIAEKAGISGEVQGLAVRIIRKAEQRRITVGKDPTGVAAAALYIASQLKEKKVTQGEIAKAANITDVTIRNRKVGLVKGLDLKL
jgi:transcription initiation factor TFIIB